MEELEHDPWEYRVEVVKNPDVRHMTEALNRLGAKGWELVSGLSTVKTWVNVTGNDVVLLFKRPGLADFPEEPEVPWA